MTQVFYSSTFFGAMTLAAATDAGRFGPHADRRLLIVANNATVPEITPRLDNAQGFDRLRDRFDDIVSWNEIIWPMHPSEWDPPAAEIPMLSRLMKDRLGLPDAPRELVVESIAVAPARTLATLLNDGPVTAYSDGLMSYGPTRSTLPMDVAHVQRLLYLDLVPNLSPLLLRERGVVCDAIPTEAFTRVVAGLPTPDAAPDIGSPVIVGQYLSAIGLISPDEEQRLHARMMTALVARGHRRIAFKPHPATGDRHSRHLREVAVSLGVHLTVIDQAIPCEAWFAAARPALVVSCFSTALMTARQHCGLPVATMGAGLLLERITPYQNSNRIPATIIAATLPELLVTGELREPAPVDIGHLVRAVSYCMQPNSQADLRADARTYLAAHGPERYFKKRRLEALELRRTPLSRARILRGPSAARRRLTRSRDSGPYVAAAAGADAQGAPVSGASIRRVFMGRSLPRWRIIGGRRERGTAGQSSGQMIS